MSKLPLITGLRAAGSVFLADPGRLSVQEGYNVRHFDIVKNPDDKELVASIKARGVTTPLTVRRIADKLFIRSGHRRYAAVQYLIANGTPIKAVPVIILPTDEEKPGDDILDLLTSNSGKPLSSLEKGAVFARLRTYKWTDAEIADKAGMSSKQVKTLIGLHNSSPELKKWVAQGVITATLAAELLAKEGGERAAKIVEKAVKLAPKTGARTGKVGVTEAAAVQAAEGSAKVVERKVPLKGRGPVAPGANKPAPSKAADMKAEDKPGALAVLNGPFRAQREDILDATGFGIATADSPAVARTMVQMLNFGLLYVADVRRANEAKAKAEAAKAAPAPAAPMPPPVKAAPAKARATRGH